MTPPRPAAAVRPAIDTPAGVYYVELRFLLRLRRPVANPELALNGPAFRGALGNRLRTLACLTGAHECAGCALRAHCAFPMLFAPDDDVPRPFFLRAPVVHDDGRAELQLTLVGSALTHMPLVIEAVRQMGQDCTVARIQFDVAEVGARCGNQWRGVADALRPQPGAPADPASAPVVRFADLQRQWRGAAPRAAVVRLTSPLQIRRDKHLLQRVHAGIFVQRLAQRVHELDRLYCGGGEGASAMADILALVERLWIRRADTAFVRGATWSFHQKADICFDGIVGEFILAGDVGPLAPYLLAGQALGVGKKTTRGCGEYEVTLE